MTIVVGLATAAAAACVVLIVGTIVAVKRGAAPAELVALLPSVARLFLRLLRDPSIPLLVRSRILVAVAYNIQPINLIPDFVPLIGFADNLIITGWALRSTVRRAGREVVVRNWTGTDGGLEMVFRLAGLENRSVRRAG